MNNNRKISVITINYNDKIGLEKTIQSIVNQSYIDFEFIVIDGGSTDGSKEVLQKYQDKITYSISEPDSGVYNAMNKGIKAAKSDFVIFMNSGDIFNNDKVLQQVEPHLTSDFDIYYGNNYKVKANESKRLKTYPEKLKFSFFYGSCINHQSTFIRRKLFFDHFLYNENYKIVSDWEFFIYTIFKINVPYKYLNITISDYDFTGISSSEKHKDLVKKERFECMQKYFPGIYEDYEKIGELNSKRIQQIFHIQKYPTAWKILKTFISVVLVFTPKFYRE